MKTSRRRLDRDAAMAELAVRTFDVLVIGGGATGLGIAVDAASRGYTTALVEGVDFAKGTSSRSTKLVHGGVRYLEQLDLGLVREALHERGTMHEIAPHLVHDLPFIVPRYSWWEAPFYGVGLKLYDALAGKRNLAPSRLLNREETIAAMPNVSQDGLLGGIRYHDGQFDDARMALSLAQTAADHGAVLANRCRVNALLMRDGKCEGASCIDTESGASFDVRARCVFNATGIWSDTIRKQGDPNAKPIIEAAQGVHLVFDRSFAPSGEAIMVPHTDDGRVLFVIPWHDRALVGTTDTPMKAPALEPHALPEEIDFILRNAARYLERDPTRADVRAVFAGMRPLVHEGGVDSPSKKLSRSHKVEVAESGLVSVTGGKWTTYRKMAEDAVDAAIHAKLVPSSLCRTATLRVHGAPTGPIDRDGGRNDWRLAYGTDWDAIESMMVASPALAAPIHHRLPWPKACVLWAMEQEMAISAEDVLARRTRALFLDARAVDECAHEVAALMGRPVSDATSLQDLARQSLPADISP
ncbi:MAG: glycerol-3-phosphate dehydrogenase/oxidase [Planctomycetota bacterium]|nr:glycerol-3-phosphate dehydrogenase/oxidase [Planctomycetota bacterium]